MAKKFFGFLARNKPVHRCKPYVSILYCYNVYARRFFWGRSAQTDRNIETPSQHQHSQQFFSELPHGATASFTSSTFMPIIKIFTNSFLVSVFSAVRFCPHDVIMHGAHMWANSAPRPIQPLQYRPTAVSVLTLLNICSMAEMQSSIDETKVFFGTNYHFSFHIMSFAIAVSCKIIQDFVRNFIENKGFLPWNIFNKTEWNTNSVNVYTSSSINH